jgi:hypothetical protein
MIFLIENNCYVTERDRNLHRPRASGGVALVPDRLDRTSLPRLFGEGDFFRGNRLALYEGETGLVVALENGRRRFAAEITVDALGIDVPGAENILRETISGNSHDDVG